MDWWFLILHCLPVAHSALLRSCKSIWSDSKRHETTGYVYDPFLQAQLTPISRLGCSFTPLFNIQRDYHWCTCSACFWCLQQVYERHVCCVDSVSCCFPVCNHPLTFTAHFVHQTCLLCENTIIPTIMCIECPSPVNSVLHCLPPPLHPLSLVMSFHCCSCCPYPYLSPRPTLGMSATLHNV